MKNGFSLIELLIVVAIIGVLASVGIIAYNGFIISAKKNMATTQHNEIVKFINVSIAKCTLNSNTIILKSYHGHDTNFNCYTDPGVWRNSFNSHFHGLKWKNAYNTQNPWDANRPSCCLPDNGNTWILGITALGAVGSYIIINTDIDGNRSNRLTTQILDYRLR